MLPYERIETPRLILRPVKQGDEIAINKAVNNTLAMLQDFYCILG